MKEVQADREGGRWKRYGKANTQTDRQTDRNIVRQKDAKRDRHRQRHTKIQKNRRMQ